MPRGSPLLHGLCGCGCVPPGFIGRKQTACVPASMPRCCLVPWARKSKKKYRYQVCVCFSNLAAVTCRLHGVYAYYYCCSYGMILAHFFQFFVNMYRYQVWRFLLPQCVVFPHTSSPSLSCSLSCSLRSTSESEKQTAASRCPPPRVEVRKPKHNIPRRGVPPLTAGVVAAPPPLRPPVPSSTRRRKRWTGGCLVVEVVAGAVCVSGRAED